MERVMAGFRLYKAVEIALLGTGIALPLAFPRREGPYAAGIGLLVQAGLMLTLGVGAPAALGAEGHGAEAQRGDAQAAAAEQRVVGQAAEPRIWSVPRGTPWRPCRPAR